MIFKNFQTDFSYTYFDSKYTICVNLLEYDLYLGHLSKHFENYFIKLLYTKHFNMESAFLESMLYIYLTIMDPKVYFSHCFNQSLLESFNVHILNSILGVNLPKNGFVFNICSKRFVAPICWLKLHIFCEILAKISSVDLRLEVPMDIQTEAKYI